MKIAEIISKFRGDKQQRAATEFAELGKQIAADPAASVDAESVTRILDNAGVSADDLEREVDIQRTRADIRTELADADKRIRQAQSARDLARDRVNAALQELQDARAECVAAESGLDQLGKRIGGHYRYLVDTAPEHLRARKAEVNSQIADLQSRLQGATERLPWLEQGTAGYHPSSPQSQDLQTEIEAVKSAIEAMKAEHSALQAEQTALNSAILNA